MLREPRLTGLYRANGAVMMHAWRSQIIGTIERWYSIPLLLLLWQAAVGSGLVESRLLPSLSRVWSVLMSDKIGRAHV